MRTKSKVAMVRNLLTLRDAELEARRAVDAQLEEITRRMSVGETVEVDNEVYVLENTFSKSNTAWRAARIHALDIVPLKP